MRINFNDDNTNKGVEGWYDVKGDILIVYAKPTNSREDWGSNFIAIPWYDRISGRIVHLGFIKYARWMRIFIDGLIIETGVSKVYLFGYSMGGGVIQETGEYWSARPMKIISIDGPRTTLKITSDCKLYYNRGSLVNRMPPWFKRIKNAICLNNKWRPFWVSHNDYDIDKIIEKEIEK